jgi:selenocysteine-specific translation elongation factor
MNLKVLLESDLLSKGVDADEVSRGDVLCSRNASNLKITTDAIHAELIKSPYHKGDITENQTYLLSVGIQIKPVKIKNTNTYTIGNNSREAIGILLWTLF